MDLEVISRYAAQRRVEAPVLFVHGAWHGAWCWDDNVLGYLADRGFDAHAVSLRGHGGSPGRERLRWTRVSEYVDDVAAVVAQLGPDTVLVGHSMGGLVVQKYLERHTAPAAVLVAAVPPRGVLPVALHVARDTPGVFARMNLTMSLYPLVATPEAAQELFFSPSMPEATVRAHQERMQDESYLGFLGMLAFALPRPARVRTPVHVLGAEHDAVFSVRQVHATAAAYGTEAVISPGMAHDMMLEEGWEDVADEIIGWLNRQLATP